MLMHLTCLNQFYPPDIAPTGQYLADLAGAMVRRGHTVTVICSRWGYRGGGPFPESEMRDGVTVLRVGGARHHGASASGKLMSYAAFYTGARRVLRELAPASDLILSLTTPPYLGLLARRAAIRCRSKHAHWIMDLYPDVLVAHGMVRQGSWWGRRLEGLTRRQLSGSALTVTLGPDMDARARQYVGDGERARLRWLPLWAPLEPEATVGEAKGRRPGDDLVLMYSGNMGRGHRFTEFLAAAEALRGDAGVRWIFAGDGARSAELDLLLEAYAFERVERRSPVSQEQLRSHLLEGDVHLVSLEPAWDGCMVPSKVMTLFALGRPVIFVGSTENSVARWVAESGGGWVVAPNDLDGLLAAIRDAREPGQRRSRAQAALRFAKERFAREASCATLCSWLEAAI